MPTQEGQAKINSLSLLFGIYPIRDRLFFQRPTLQGTGSFSEGFLAIVGQSYLLSCMIPRVRHFNLAPLLLSALLWSLSLELSVMGAIPLVDLTSETTRRTIVDREEGQYLGHPTTVLLAGLSLLGSGFR